MCRCTVASPPHQLSIRVGRKDIQERQQEQEQKRQQGQEGITEGRNVQSKKDMDGEMKQVCVGV